MTRFCVTFVLCVTSALADGHAIPLGFERNVGQTDSRVQFLARTNAFQLFLTSSEAVMAISGAQKSGSSIRMRLEGSHPHPNMQPIDPMAGSTNYFFGRRHYTNIPRFGGVRYQSVYTGIDLIYRVRGGDIEFDFIVAPGADPGKIELAFAGARNLAVDKQGDLIVRAAGGTFRQHRARVYQGDSQNRKEIACRYRLGNNGRVRLELARYDRSRRLLIDPLLTYTFYSGVTAAGQSQGSDAASRIAIDSAGYIYITGETAATNFPTSSGAYATSGNSNAANCNQGPVTTLCTDAFVLKLNPSGDTLVYSTYLGGSNVDTGSGIAVDSSGNTIVTGSTQSSDFPVTTSAAQPGFGGGICYVEGFSEQVPGTVPCADAFVAKLDPTGSKLIYSTYLGGSASDSSSGVAVDSSGNAYVTGSTSSTSFPVTPNVFQGKNGGGTCTLDLPGNALPTTCSDAFVTKLDPNGKLVYSTYLGGSGTDSGAAIAVDSDGNAYVAGGTQAADFPLASNSSAPSPGQGHAFIVELNPQASGLIYSTQLGGGLYDSATGIVLGATGAHVVGITSSPDFSYTHSFAAGHVLPDGTPNTEIFAAELDPSGKIVYAVQLGDWSGDPAVAIDGSGNTYVLGLTNDQDFPVTAGAIDACNSADPFLGNQFLVKLSADGTTLLYSTFLPTSANGMALDSLGNIWLVGGTFDFGLPLPITQAVSSIASPTQIGVFVSRLDLSAPFQFGITCVANAAMFVQGAITPGEIISIFGAGLGPAQGVGLQLDSQGHVATQAGGTSVLIGGVLAPILYAQANQINAVAPYAIAAATVTTLQVEYQGQRTPAVSLSVAPASPAIFTIDGSGAGQGAILNQDGTLNSAANPAAKGSIVSLFATGDGVESPAQPDGAVTAVPYPAPVASVQVFFGAPEVAQEAADILYAGAAPTLVAGVLQVNARIPEDLKESGQVPLQLFVGGLSVDSDTGAVAAGPVTVAVK